MAPRSSCSSGRGRRRCRGGSRGCCGGLGRLGGYRSGGCGIIAFALFEQNGDQAVDLDARAALGDDNLADETLIDGLEFHRGLVGLDLGDDLAGLDLVTLFDQPFGERALFHRRGKCGHQNFNCHIPEPP
jgi:hypothetical protein